MLRAFLGGGGPGPLTSSARVVFHRLQAFSGDKHLLFHNGLEHAILIIRNERQAAKNHPIQGHTERPHIDCAGDLGHTANLIHKVITGITQFWRIKGRCANRLGQFSHVIDFVNIRFLHLVLFLISHGLSEIRDTKVGDLDLMVPGEKQIRWLDVTMNDTLVMKVFQTKHRVPEGIPRFVDGQAWYVGHFIIISKPLWFGWCIAKAA